MIKKLEQSLRRTYFARGIITGLFVGSALLGYRTGDGISMWASVVVSGLMIVAVIGETRGRDESKEA